MPEQSLPQTRHISQHRLSPHLVITFLFLQNKRKLVTLSKAPLMGAKMVVGPPPPTWGAGAKSKLLTFLIPEETLADVHLKAGRQLGELQGSDQHGESWEGSQ